MMKFAKNDHSPHHDGFTNKVTATKTRSRFIYMAIAGALLVAMLVTASQLFTTPVSANAGSRAFNSLFAPAAGTVTIKSGNYLGASTTQTATFTKQIYSSGDCTSGGGSIDTVTGVDPITGHTFALGAGSSVQVTIPDSGIYFQHVSEQNGPFVAWQAADNAYGGSVIYSGPGHQVCIQGFDGSETRTYLAQFYPGIELFDECGNERYDFRPGETMTIKVSGGLKLGGEAMRLFVAGGGVNECTFLPTGPAFTTVHVTSDPFTVEFTLPASDGEIPSYCSSMPTTTILGQWRVGVYDSGCNCNRNDLKFNVANDAVQPGCDDGTLTIKSANYLGASTTQTARFTKQTYSSSDCTGAAGPLETVTGVDSITGHTFTLGAGNSVQVTIPGGGSPYEYQSEQRGPFVSWAAADNSYFDSVIYSGDGHQVCIQGFDGVSPRTYLARYYAGIQMYDACGHELYSYRPGETVTFKVSGGLTNHALPLKLLAAGGSVNDCTWLPAGTDPLVEITSDPFFYDFTFPDSNDDIPAHCISSNSTSILGDWRVVAFDQSCGCNRTETRFTLADDAPQPGCADGLINIKSGNYLGGTTTQTATFTKQVFSSANCTSGGGSIETVTGVDSLTGTSFSLPAGDSVQVTIPPSGLYFQYVSEQNGPFVAWQAADNSYFNSVIYSGDGHQVCIQGFTGSETRTYRAQFYPGIEMFDTCDNERYDFRPGETVKLKITGGLKPGGAPMRLLVAGGGVNECTFVPEGPSFTTVTIDADPFYYEFTLPASNADIPSHCASSPTTDILGQWRAVIFDPGLGGNRNDLKFNLALDAPQPGCAMACPGDITVSNDPGSCGAVVNYAAPTTPPTVTCNYPSGSTFPVGTTQVTCTSTAGPSCSFNVTVNDTEDPTITAPADLPVNTGSTSCVATGVALGAPTTGDNCAVFSVANDAPLVFPAGPTTVTWTVTDIHGRTATDTQVVTVGDATSPIITLSTSVITLSQINHSYSTVSVANFVSGASDNCTALGLGSVYITSVSSDEPENGSGDGNTLNDMVIAADCKSVQLRGERDAGSNGRVYTLWFKVVDAAGNVGTASATVTVPKNKKTAAVDDGPSYVVTSGCP